MANVIKYPENWNLMDLLMEFEPVDAFFTITIRKRICTFMTTFLGDSLSV